ncbi:MAG: hypothetical protein JNM70_16840 [Anaerolineae bacterium]|nr:hypothetical protein [Anaerolineae bacterium]
MTVQLRVEFETLLDLVDQLSDEQRQRLMRHIQQSEDRAVTQAEWKTLFESTVLDLGPIAGDFSNRREDWYGDDGR